jgi:hypothetical protein
MHNTRQPQQQEKEETTQNYRAKESTITQKYQGS